MKILIATNKYVPESNGGAERSMYELVKWASCSGHSITILTQGDHDSVTEHANTKRLPKLTRENFTEIVTELTPDVCICQLDWTPIVVKVCNELKVPVIHSSRVGDFNKNADAWLFNNKKNADYWSEQSSLDSERVHVCYPLVRVDKQRFFKKGRKKFITIVNPVRAKGGKILERLACDFFNETFVAVHGWHDPQLDEVDLSLPNIIYLDRQRNMDLIFEQTKVLLVPSLWDDPSPRVILEAAHYEIPIIASKKGGIPEFVHDKDMLFDVEKPEEAVFILKKLLEDIQFYEEKKREMQKIATKYNPDQFLPDAMKFIQSVTLKNNYTPDYEQEFVNMEWFNPKHEK
jgi:hypothetical protein